MFYLEKQFPVLLADWRREQGEVCPPSWVPPDTPPASAPGVVATPPPPPCHMDVGGEGDWGWNRGVDMWAQSGTLGEYMEEGREKGSAGLVRWDGGREGEWQDGVGEELDGPTPAVKEAEQSCMLTGTVPPKSKYKEYETLRVRYVQKISAGRGTIYKGACSKIVFFCLIIFIVNMLSGIHPNSRPLYTLAKSCQNVQRNKVRSLTSKSIHQLRLNIVCFCLLSVYLTTLKSWFNAILRN